MVLKRDFKASNPSDHIIGIHGLVNEKPTDQLVPFHPDYTVPACTLYHRFAIHLVDLGLALPMLNFAGLQRRSQVTEIPSWVPDWTAQTVEAASRPLAIFSHGYSASGNRSLASFLARIPIAAVSPSHDPDVLIVKGTCADTVSHTTASYFQGTQNNHAAAATAFLSWHNTANYLAEREVIQNGENSIYGDSNDALARTLIANDLYTGENAIPNSSPILLPTYSHFAAIRSLQEVSNGIGVVSKSAGMMDAIDTFKMQMMSTCHGRKFAVTEKGYLALVPHCAEIGDRIALLLGCSIPFILRDFTKIITREGEKLAMQMVGDAYVHGIMNGEAMEFEGFKPESIWLK
jgi:hypothetical protein